MPVQNENLRCNFPQPLDDRYYSDGGIPWSSPLAANLGIVPTRRYVGLTINILNEEWWYANDTTDGGLVKKHNPGALFGAGNPNQNQGTQSQAAIIYWPFPYVMVNDTVMNLTILDNEMTWAGAITRDIGFAGDPDTALQGMLELLSTLDASYYYEVDEDNVTITIFKREVGDFNLSASFVVSQGSLDASLPVPTVTDGIITAGRVIGQYRGQLYDRTSNDEFWAWDTGAWVLLNKELYTDAQDIYITIRDDDQDGNGTFNDPYDGSGRKLTDIIIGESYANRPVNWHFGPGRYLLKPSFAQGYAPENTRLWFFRNGWHWQGLGMDRTTFVMDGSFDGFTYFVSNIQDAFLPIIPEDYIFNGSIRGIKFDGERTAVTGTRGERAMVLAGARLTIEDNEVTRMGGYLGEFYEEFCFMLVSGNAVGGAFPVPKGAFHLIQNNYLHHLNYNDASGTGPDAIKIGQCTGILCMGVVFEYHPNQQVLIKGNRLIRAGYINLANNSVIDSNYVDTEATGQCIHADSGSYENCSVINNTLLNAFYGYSAHGIIRIGGGEAATPGQFKDIRIYNNAGTIVQTGYLSSFVLAQGGTSLDVRNNVLLQPNDFLAPVRSITQTTSNNVILYDLDNRFASGELLVFSDTCLTHLKDDKRIPSVNTYPLIENAGVGTIYDNRYKRIHTHGAGAVDNYWSHLDGLYQQLGDIRIFSFEAGVIINHFHLMQDVAGDPPTTVEVYNQPISGPKTLTFVWNGTAWAQIDVYPTQTVVIDGFASNSPTAASSANNAKVLNDNMAGRRVIEYGVSAGQPRQALRGTINAVQEYINGHCGTFLISASWVDAANTFITSAEIIINIEKRYNDNPGTPYSLNAMSLFDEGQYIGITLEVNVGTQFIFTIHFAGGGNPTHLFTVTRLARTYSNGVGIDQESGLAPVWTLVPEPDAGWADSSKAGTPESLAKRITGLIAPGAGISVSGTGLASNPYVISSSAAELADILQPFLDARYAQLP